MQTQPRTRARLENFFVENLKTENVCKILFLFRLNTNPSIRSSLPAAFSKLGGLLTTPRVFTPGFYSAAL